MNAGPALTLYGSPTCHQVAPVRALLDRAGIEYEYVDIARDAGARARLIEINQGYASVPTLLLPDGSALTEPSLEEVRRRLNDFGYEAPALNLGERLLALAQWPGMPIGGAALLALGLLGGNEFLLAAGALLILLGLGARRWAGRVP